MSRLFAGFSSHFEEASFNRGGFDGLIVAAPDEMAAEYFTETGFDTVDHDRAPDIREVLPIEGLNYATYEDLDSAAASIGIAVFMSESDQQVMFPNAAFSPGMRNFDSEPNELLEIEAVRNALHQKGFDAFRGYVTVGIDVIDATILWQPGSFSLSDPVPLITEDEVFPSEVKIDFDALAAATPSRS
ncbi:hypothetical protein G6L37_01155 [Agrobacterium rubi]|nr:hypothetical protein [Agrobacterium rubi]NTF23999.1 hypothetical protein [Agrobacterium rubi]